MKSPFKFLDAFELKDRDVFFGRDEEIETLYNMVFQTPLLLLFGLSGTGKTSLIRCGLASRYIGPNWYPFYIRRGDNINLTLSQALSNALPEEETPLEHLKDNVSLLFRHYLRPIYLIFDQFEELFILGEREEQEIFAQSLRELIEAKLPCKIILVMREEFIGQLYYLEKEIPNIYDFRLRVEPMGMKKVQEVITGSLQHFQVQLADPAQNLQLMYNNISVGKSGVQLPYLQVYMDMFWREDFVRTYPEPAEQEQWQAALGAEPPAYPPLEFTGAEIEAFGDMETVLVNFLRQQEAELQRELKAGFRQDIPPQTVRSILDLFVTDQGTKQPQRYHRLEGKLQLLSITETVLPQLPAGALSFALEHLYNARLLRERDDALELAHDSLAALVFNERSDEQRRQNEASTIIKNVYQLHPKTGEYLSRRQLVLVEEHLEKILSENTPELSQFVKNSINDADQKEQAELEGQKRRVRYSYMIAFAGIGLAIFSFSQYYNANTQKQNAISEKTIADSLRLISEENLAALQRANAKEDSVAVSKIIEGIDKLESKYPDVEASMVDTAKSILNSPENKANQFLEGIKGKLSEIEKRIKSKQNGLQ